MEEPQIGDPWTYQLRDEITGDIRATIINTVTDTSASGIGIRIASLGNPNYGYETFDRSWNMIDSDAWRYEPNDGSGIKAPLTVGETWSFEGNELDSTAALSWKRSGTSKVLAQESVTTRAGTFDTFRIETAIQEQSLKDPTRSVQFMQQTWYAPAINHWVKRTSVSRTNGRVRANNTIELVEYGQR